MKIRQVLRRRGTAILNALIVLLVASRVNAQTLDPTLVEFDPSPDHSLTSNGTPIVSRYDLEIFVAGASQAFQVLDIGKPNPASDGKIRVSFVPTWPTTGTTYEARVAAIGSTGMKESGTSNQFTYSGVCSYTLNASALSVTAGNGSGAVGVLTGTSCTWTASSPVSWITVAGGTRTGPGTANLSIAANTATTSRSATLTVAGRPFTVTQAGASSSCAPSISPTALFPPPGGTTGTIAVTVAAGCSWSAVGDEWVRFSPTSGTGNGSVTYQVDPNQSTSSRSWTVKVAGTTVTLTQGAGGGCSFTVAPGSVSAPGTGSTGTLAVTTTTGCAWTASSPASWVTVQPASGSGNANVTFTVAANTTTAARSVSLTVAGKSVAVSQAAACTYTLSTSLVSLAAAGGSGTVAVATQSGCTWTASSPTRWVTVTPASASGSGSATYTAASNSSSKSRNTTLSIAGKTLQVSQSGTTLSHIEVLPPGQNDTPILEPSPGVTDIVARLSVAATREANPSVAVSMEPSRDVAAIMEAGPSVAATMMVTPTVASLEPGPSATTMRSSPSVAASPAARQSVAASTALSPAPSPSVAASMAPGVRGAANVVLTTQAASLPSTGCVFTLSPSSLVFLAQGGTGSIRVSTSTACSWSANDAPWIRLTSGQSGMGGGMLSFDVDENRTGANRTVTLLIAGQTIDVAQQK